jgi:error-prone DNA polymerase
VVRFAQAAKDLGVPTVFGAELTLCLECRQNGVADPEGRHLLVLARDPGGYARLSAAIADAHLQGGQKGRPVFALATLAGAYGGHWMVLTGCRKGDVPHTLMTSGPRAAGRALDRLLDAFGRQNVAVELWDHHDPLDSARNDALARLGITRGLEVVATTNAHAATPAGHHLACALAAVRARRSLDEMDGWLPGGPGAHLRSGAEQARRFARYPGVVEAAGRLAEELIVDLELLAPGLPPFPVPGAHDEASFLRQLVESGAEQRYGPRDAERVKGAWAQIDYEMGVIEALGFPGYFLVVWDIVRF